MVFLLLRSKVRLRSDYLTNFPVLGTISQIYFIAANLENNYLNDVSCQHKSTDDWACDTLGDETSTSSGINPVVVKAKIPLLNKMRNFIRDLI